MNEKEKYFIDLSKLSEDERKHIFSLLPPETEEDDYEITDNCRYLRTVSGIWMVTFQTNGRTELTYPDFIKLFEGGGEKEIDIEKMAKEALKFQHKNIQDRMIDFVLGFEEGFKKAIELNSNQ